MSRKQAQANQLAKILSKDIGKNNPIFTEDHIVQLHNMFSLYADPRQRKADMRDILMTAKVLALDTKFDLVYRALEEIAEESGSDALDFETFLNKLNLKIGSPFHDNGRRATFDLVDSQKKGVLDINDLRYLNEQFKYGFDDTQLTEIIHTVGGYGADEITWEKFNRYVMRRIEKRKI